MKMSFRLKVVAVFLVGILLSMFCMTFMSTVFLRPIFISNSKHTMIDYAEKLSNNLNSDKDVINGLLEEINTSYGITTHITDRDGNILFSYSKSQSNVTSNNIGERYRKYVSLYNKKDIDENYYFKERTDFNDNIRKIVYIGQAKDGNFIIMNKAIKGIEQDIKLVSIFIMIMGLTVAVVGTVVWSIFTKTFTDKIKKMSIVTKKMSQLDFDEKIDFSGNDEIAALSESINTMSDELKESIKSLQDDLERRKRLIRDISHELKTPVTTIKGYIENIQYITEEDKKLKRYCEIAVEECDSMDNLIQEMLEMSRLESDGYSCDMEITDTLDIVSLINSKLDTEFRSFKFYTEFDKAYISCNKVLISRAVVNFIKNATKYGKAASEIQVKGKLRQDGYYFSVTNKGPALTREEQENIWSLFYKADKSRHRDSSHGIGLSIVKQIAKIHGGEVGIESGDGKNTFYIRLPQVSENKLL